MNRDSLFEVPIHPLRERLKQQTVRDILAAAEAVFGDKGFQGASMNDIAKAAGVAVGTLYNHFADRSALVSELCNARGAELLALLDGVLARDGEPFAAQIEAFMRTLLDAFHSHRKLYIAIIQGEHLPHLGDRRSRVTLKGIHDRAEVLVRRGEKAKILKPDPARVHPALLVGVVRSMLLREIVGAATSDLREHAPILARFFLAGAGA